MDESYYSRIQARPKYNYLDRDLQLPVQIHQNVQSFRDSPDEGEWMWLLANRKQHLIPF